MQIIQVYWSKPMQSMLNVKNISLVVFVIFSLLGASLTSAQSDAPSGRGMGQGPSGQTQFSDDQLEAFVAASKKVNEISAEYRPRIEQTQDRERALELQQEASNAMVEMINSKENLDVETYNAIAQAASTDAKLAQKIQKLMEQSQRSW
ncbi:DUF4168 domain-containing protein [Nitrosococcus wardiae]|nr:DUF4168 domain-containing protein [Nitrosococcus wardiae]